MKMSRDVILLAFNRPDLTRRVLQRVVESRPDRLFVVCDGPRDGNPVEAARVAAVRALCADLPFEVRRRYAEVNLGCRRCISSGLDWAFTQVEEAVILEDDCLPDPTFFPYCWELLERFRHEPSIGYISGNNFTAARDTTHFSYHISLFGGTWGWATWRRAWALYDSAMTDWPVMKARRRLYRLLNNRLWARHYESELDAVYSGAKDTWDYVWAYSTLNVPVMVACPAVNLVANIGFGTDATHTKASESRLTSLGLAPMAFPLRHPPVKRDRVFERDTIRALYREDRLSYRLKARYYRWRLKSAVRCEQKVR